MKTSIDIIFPEIDELLNPWRRETIELSQKGVPPHISIIYPWFDTPIEDENISHVEEIIKTMDTFSVEFDTIKKFENGVVYFSLSDCKNIKKIQKKITEKYPNIRLYNGEIENPIIHLTIAKIESNDEEMLLKIKKEIGKILPLRKKISEITIMIEDESGFWSNYKSIKLNDKILEKKRACR